MNALLKYDKQDFFNVISTVSFFLNFWTPTLEVKLLLFFIGRTGDDSIAECLSNCVKYQWTTGIYYHVFIIMKLLFSQ